MDGFIDLLQGNLTPAARVWSALGPGLVLAAYVVLTFVAYVIRYYWIGPYRDEELEKRDRTVLTHLWLRLYFAWAIRPIWFLILRSGIPASAITTLSVLLSLASGVALAVGRFTLGGWLFIFAGVCDFFDGRVARKRNQVSPAGNLLDSVLDRYSDAAVFLGLAWFYRDSWILLAVLLALVGAQLTSYVRAKGESLSIDIRVGLMQRPERVAILGIGVALSPIVEVMLDPYNPRPSHRVAMATLVVLAVTTQTTAARRLVYGLNALGTKPFASWVSTARGSLVRNVTAAFIATAVDFVVFATLVGQDVLGPGFATAVGCGVGAVINFTINRIWVFGSRGAPARQAYRYAFVSTTSALLNAGGVVVLLLVPSTEARLAWVIVRATVYLAWNFPLQRDYVFKDDRD